MARQLVFDLPLRTAMGREDFFVSPDNAAAVRGLEDWRDWPFGKMLLIGPEGSGKTHLAHVWAAMAPPVTVVAARDLDPDDITGLTALNGVAVEDADTIAGDRAAETALFHLHNALADAGVPLLVTARDVPERWGLVLPDLESRMSQADRLRLAPPDDTLLMAVMVKLAQDRQMQLTPKVLSYALLRIERSFAAAQAFIAALDAEALARKSKPGLKIAKAVLAQDPD